MLDQSPRSDKRTPGLMWYLSHYKTEIAFFFLENMLHLCQHSDDMNFFFYLQCFGSKCAFVSCHSFSFFFLSVCLCVCHSNHQILTRNVARDHTFFFFFTLHSVLQRLLPFLCRTFADALGGLLSALLRPARPQS